MMIHKYDEIRVLQYCAQGPSVGHEGAKSYRQWFGDDAGERDGYLGWLLQWEMEQGYVIAWRDKDNKIILGHGHNGLSPTGYERLARLEHPVRYWCKDNWFGVLVGLGTVATGLTVAATSVLGLLLGGDP